MKGYEDRTEKVQEIPEVQGLVRLAGMVAVLK